MSTRFVDLSLSLEDLPSERVPVRVRRVDHRAGATEMSAIFGVQAADLPDGLGWAGEELTLISHAGTHMDAPWHYGPLSDGLPALTIDEVPLEWCQGPGVVLDFRHKSDAEEIGAQELGTALGRANHVLSGGDIVLLMTGADRYWGLPEYPDRGAGINREGVLWLLERGVRVIGIDAWGLDRSFAAMREDYARDRDVTRLWPSHFAGRTAPYCQLEKLTRLDVLPTTGFRVTCFPVKIARGSAGWCRVVATLENRNEVCE